jgi:membrane associated rhomboid family serine protease
VGTKPDDKPGPDPGPARDADDAWIERVVGLAGHLGFNKMRLRWKLIRWQEQRRRRARRREQVVAHITYAHKTCPECGAVQDRDEAVCTGCGARLGSRRFQLLERIGLAIPVPASIATLLAVAILVAYGRVWLAGGGGLSGPSGSLLVEFGGRWPPLMSEEPWRLVTAMFLHAGILHLGFNLLAIASIGPRVEELYGRPTMLGLFIVTGVLANVATLQVASPAIGIGASGGVMGLIGAAAAWGQRAGTGRGRAMRDAMLMWIGYTFLFGLFVGADHWAHLFGAIAGAVFGFLVKPEVWMRRALVAVRAGAGIVGLVATVGAVAIICARTPAPPEPSSEGADASPATGGEHRDHRGLHEVMHAKDLVVPHLDRLDRLDDTAAMERDAEPTVDTDRDAADRLVAPAREHPAVERHVVGVAGQPGR